MLRKAIALAGFLLAANSDTVWWRTDGGAVTGHRDSRGLTCTLTLDDGAGRIAFAWAAGLPLRVMAERESWRFEPEAIVRVALRIGPVWAASGHGEPNITALTARSALLFLLEEPMEDWLLKAEEVTVVAPPDRLLVSVPSARLRPLMAALDRCRKLIA